MTTFATTKMSSKGQIVIPEEIRAKLQLEPGTQFVAVGEGDVVILKKISPPTMEIAPPTSFVVLFENVLVETVSSPPSVPSW